MNQLMHSFESKLAILALVFFTRVLDFESSFKASEGTAASLIPAGANPLAPILSLMQHGIFLVVLGLLFLRSKDTLETLKRGKIIWLVVILVPLSVLWSNIPDVTFRGAFAFIESCAFGLYLASRYTLKEQLRLIAWALAIASLISLFYTLVLPNYAIEDGIHAGAWRGPYIQKNIFARLLILGCLSCICINPRKLWHKYLMYGWLTLSFGLVILSQSKTALIVLVLLILLSLVCHSLRLKNIVAIPSVLTLILLTSGAAISVAINAERILASVGKDLTLSGRTVIWQGLIQKIQLRPWFGYGYMGFWDNIESRSFIDKVFGTTYSPPHSHNGYLELVTSFGFIGAVLFAISFLAIARRAIILMYWEKTRDGLWPLLFLSFLIFYNFTEPTFIEHNSVFWIIYLALAISRFIDLESKPQFNNYQTN